MARALVTGSTAGLGLEFAWQLAGTGHDLVLVARSEDRLHAVAEQIRHVHRVDIEVLPADLSVRRELDRVARRLTDPVDRISLLVNNAGYGLRGQFLEVPIEDHERQMDTLIRAVLVLSHAAARAMVQRRCGAILNVSSLAGYTAAGPYAASKSWVTVFTESLATELRGTGVTATALLPGFVQTEFHERASMNVEGLPRVTWLKAPYVVEQALRDTAAGHVLSIPSVKYRAAGEVSRLAPRRLMRFLTGPAWETRLSRRRLRRSRRTASKRELHAPWEREGQ
ncbi:SDR family oxidoreductase [Brachybacterium sp. JHP9]|uniref:SDR family oxidoreductase n=1 Tax=Brachybacterium equifaecis TaxID=2910770 RepID=A0ABT0R0C1_9MICO|nr:SDR family oxidoreductase [Brachybacterium equifaecis]MCL6422410.1 SDR family oxidoreductase [Brachybacterium equifaecis]